MTALCMMVSPQVVLRGRARRRGRCPRCGWVSRRRLWRHPRRGREHPDYGCHTLLLSASRPSPMPKIAKTQDTGTKSGNG